MHKLTDEDIQRLLDDNSKIESSYEVGLYQKVFSELSTLPDVKFNHLADGVVKTLQKQEERRAMIKTYLAIALCIGFCFCVFMASVFTVEESIAMNLLSVLNSYNWVVMFLSVTSAIACMDKDIFQPFTKDTTNL
jgi:hypothetical protein